MQLSNIGLALIKNFEGLRLSAYSDVAGIWTIGYGSTRYTNGTHVKKGDHLTSETQAGLLFQDTLGQYEEAVNRMAKVPLTQNQYDALVSFAYNTGTGALKASTLLKKLNEKDYAGAANAFLAWNKITDPHTGKKIVCETLTQRRKEESNLFLSI